MNDPFRMEYLSIQVPLITIGSFVERFQRLFDLPDFTIDFENEYQWAEVRSGEVGFNICRRHDGEDPEHSLVDEDWGIIVKCFDELPFVHDPVWVRDIFIPEVGSIIGNEFKQPVSHTRTWIRGGTGWVILNESR